MGMRREQNEKIVQRKCFRFCVLHQKHNLFYKYEFYGQNYSWHCVSSKRLPTPFERFTLHWWTVWGSFVYGLRSKWNSMNLDFYWMSQMQVQFNQFSVRSEFDKVRCILLYRRQIIKNGPFWFTERPENWNLSLTKYIFLKKISNIGLSHYFYAFWSHNPYKIRRFEKQVADRRLGRFFPLCDLALFYCMRISFYRNVTMPKNTISVELCRINWCIKQFSFTFIFSACWNMESLFCSFFHGKKTGKLKRKEFWNHIFYEKSDAFALCLLYVRGWESISYRISFLVNNREAEREREKEGQHRL